jgi:hypothetical protein
VPGGKLHGGYALTRFRSGDDETWLLVKRSDHAADARCRPVRSQPQSVLSGKALDEIGSLTTWGIECWGAAPCRPPRRVANVA